MKTGPPIVSARCYDTLAQILAHQGQEAEAESRFRSALAFRAEVIHVDHPDTAEILEHLAALLRKTGRNSEAQAIEDRAKAMRSKLEKTPATK